MTPATSYFQIRSHPEALGIRTSGYKFGEWIFTPTPRIPWTGVLQVGILSAHSHLQLGLWQGPLGWWGRCPSGSTAGSGAQLGCIHCSDGLGLTGRDRCQEQVFIPYCHGQPHLCHHYHVLPTHWRTSCCSLFLIAGCLLQPRLPASIPVFLCLWCWQTI